MGTKILLDLARKNFPQTNSAAYFDAYRKLLQTAPR